MTHVGDILPGTLEGIARKVGWRIVERELGERWHDAEAIRQLRLRMTVKVEQDALDAVLRELGEPLRLPDRAAS